MPMILDRVEWSLSDVTNAFDDVVTAADTMVFEVVARVVDVAANSGLPPTQDTNVNTAQIRYTNFNDVVASMNGTTTVDIVEPRLIINKTANVTQADAGDTVIYTVMVQNTGTAHAYNVVVTDPLLPDLELINGTVTTTPGTVTIGNTAGDTTIRADAVSLAVNGTITIRYHARLLPSVFPGQALINTASQTSNSMPHGSGRTGTSSDLGNRNGDPAGVQQGYCQHLGRLYLPGAGTTDQHTAAPDLTIGEIITYQMTIVVPEGTSNTLRLVDTCPAPARATPAPWFTSVPVWSALVPTSATRRWCGCNRHGRRAGHHLQLCRWHADLQRRRWCSHSG